MRESAVSRLRAQMEKEKKDVSGCPVSFLKCFLKQSVFTIFT